MTCSFARAPESASECTEGDQARLCEGGDSTVSFTRNLTWWTLSKSRTALIHTASPSLQFFDAPMWALAKERPEMKQICRHTGPRTTWRCLLVPAPARVGRRLKNSCFTTGISPLPVDIEVRYCRELQQPTQLHLPAPRGIVTVGPILPRLHFSLCLAIVRDQRCSHLINDH